MTSISNAASLQDVQQLALAAKSRYETRDKGDKVGKWLTSFTSRICFYGNILDVLVQHHPEYVALVWGAMKTLFIVGTLGGVLT